jgi:hypothetical protein
VTPAPFVFRKVLYLVEATGARAATLDELLRCVSVVDPLSIGFHMHREFLAHKFVHAEYPNDFAHWVARNVGDEVLGERLANLVVFRFRTLEALRAEISRLIADHLLAHPESSYARAPAGRELYFSLARSIVMDCRVTAETLEGFAAALAYVPASSIYYHLFETRFAPEGPTPRLNDFAEWIARSLGNTDLARRVADIDPYMFSLEQARRKVLSLVTAELTPQTGRSR